MGDPHLDNPGTLFRWFHDDVETVLRTPGMYVSQVGDVLDNWVGRLMSEHAFSNVTAGEGWRMVEHYAERLGPRLVVWVLGNHCKWNSGAEILPRMLRGAPCVVAEDDARVLFVLDDGSEFSLAMRHEWPGGSIYHTTHGVAKPLKFGLEVDMAIGGHKHSGGYILMPSPHTGRVRHGIQLSTYKFFDRYGKAKGFDAPMASPSVMTILDPQGGPVDRVTVYFRDPIKGFEKGLSALAALRAARRKVSVGPTA